MVYLSQVHEGNFTQVNPDTVSSEAGPNRRRVLMLLASLPFNASRARRGLGDVVTGIVGDDPNAAKAVRGAVDVADVALFTVETGTGIDRRSLFRGGFAPIVTAVLGQPEAQIEPVLVIGHEQDNNTKQSQSTDL